MLCSPPARGQLGDVSIDLEAKAQPCSFSALLLCVLFRFLVSCTHGGDTSPWLCRLGVSLDLVCPTEQSLGSLVPSPQPSQRSLPWGVVSLVSAFHLSLRVRKTKKPALPRPRHSQSTDPSTTAFQQNIMKHLFCAQWKNLMPHK